LDPVAGVQASGGVTTADDGRNSQLTDDDRGVRERGADVGDDAGGAREERGPADVGEDGDENLAGFGSGPLLYGQCDPTLDDAR
jgi:hypothetical protein